MIFNKTIITHLALIDIQYCDKSYFIVKNMTPCFYCSEMSIQILVGNIR